MTDRALHIRADPDLTTKTEQIMPSSCPCTLSLHPTLVSSPALHSNPASQASFMQHSAETILQYQLALDPPSVHSQQLQFH